MRIQEEHYDIPGFREEATRLTAHLSFRDYERLFPLLRWRCPRWFHCYGDPCVQGIEGTCADGTVLRASLLELRDALDRLWPQLVELLQEEGAPDLDGYSERLGDQKVLSLRCTTIIFDTADCACCRFDRIWGKLRF